VITPEIFDGLVSALYATVVDGDAWPETLASLRTAFGCSIVSLNTFQQGRYRSISTDPMASAEWVERWTPANPLSARKMEVGAVALAQDLVDPDLLASSAYYNEFLLPFDIPHVMILKGSSLEKGGALVNILRGRNQSEFGEADMMVAKRLSGHVVTAWRSARLLGWKAWTDHAASLEDATEGMILVDRDGAILHMNRVARALAEGRDGIVVSRQSLDAETATDGKRLRSAIWHATAGPAPRTGAMLPIERASGARALIASVTPLPEATVDIGLPRPCALIAIYDPARIVPSPTADLQRLFGLTRREAEVAQAIGDGLTIGEAALRCGVTIVTARNYLARVLRKTQLNRQSELVQLLGGIARLAETTRRS
jgi:DNA-binding CsgD family transcriptional regulator